LIPRVSQHPQVYDGFVNSIEGSKNLECNEPLRALHLCGIAYLPAKEAKGKNGNDVEEKFQIAGIKITLVEMDR
jgi:hypothetical protein